jgi:hypothetical protein
MAGNSIRITTETEKGKRELRTLNVILWIVGPLILAAGIFVALAPDDFFAQPHSLSDRLIVAIFCVAQCVLLFSIPCWITRGSWLLDDEGVSLAPLCEDPRWLGWEDVEAVHWHTPRYRVIFRSGKIKMKMTLQWETRERQDDCLNFIRDKLEKSFDLSCRPSEPISFQRLFWISAVTSILTLLCFGGLCLQTIYWNQTAFGRGLGVLWFAVPLFLLFLWGIKVVWGENRKQWRLKYSTMSGV